MRCTLRAFAGLMTLFLFYNSASSQQIVRDVNTKPASLVDVPNNATQRCFTCNDLVFFTATDSAGNELWRTDGTPEGTYRVIDLNPGPEDGVMANQLINCIEGFAYFRGVTGIWKTDGTASGTTLVTDSFLTPAGFTSFNGQVYFASNDKELWMTTDGADNLLKVIEEDDLNVNFTGFAAGLSNLYFTIVLFDGEGVKRSELWKTDGTPEGTASIKIFPFLNHHLDRLTAIGDQVFFRGIDEVQGAELWVSDGTPANTYSVADLSPGAENSEFHVIGVFQEQLVFSFNGATWISDGSEAGTQVLFPDVYAHGTNVHDDTLYLVGTEHSPPYNNLLLKTDGTPDGSVRLDTLGQGLMLLEDLPVVAGDKFILLFAGDDNGVELGVTNGTPGTIALLKDINPGPGSSSPRFFAALNNQVIFMADDGSHGFELWVTDGTTEGTKLVKDVKSGTESANIGHMHVLRDKIYFLAGLNGSDRDLWVSDGTAQGTEMIYDFSSPHVFGKTDTHLVLLDGKKIWKSDGTPEGTTPMWDYSGLANSAGYVSAPGISSGHNLYFQFRLGDQPSDLWRANTKTNVVVRVENLDPTVELSFDYFDGAPLGNELVFSMENVINGRELWITRDDGTKKELLKNILPGSAGSFPSYFHPVGDKVLFIVNDNIHGYELWATDGTPDGTAMVTDIAPGEASGVSLVNGAVINGKLIFSAQGPEGIEPWVSDGTVEGTFLLKDLSPEDSSPANFVALGDRVYFAANQNSQGAELYVTDGTTEGTSVIARHRAFGNEKSARIGDAIYFAHDDKIVRVHGPSGTIEEVGSVTALSNLYAVNNYVCFEAQLPAFGRELFSVLLTKFDQTIQFPPIVEKSLGDSPFVPEVSASSQLPVTLSSDDDHISIENGQVHLLSPGTVIITATQPGDENFNAAASVSQTFCVNPPKPTITTGRSDEGTWLSSSIDTNIEWYLNGEPLGETIPEIIADVDGLYKLVVTVDGCSSESLEIAVIYTSVEGHEPGVSVYPNPVSNVLRVRMPPTSSAQKVLVTDLMGRVIYHRTTTSSEEAFDVSAFMAGFYAIQILADDKKIVRVFLKK